MILTALLLLAIGYLLGAIVALSLLSAAGDDPQAIVDAHQMRHSAWGSPEGIMLIDSAGCAACSCPTGWIAQPPCHVLTLCACVAIGAASAQPPRRASRDRTGWRQ